VLFGDGCAAVVLQPAEGDEGLIADRVGCYADARHILRVRGHGTTYGNRGVTFGDTQWDFDGQEIFKRAVHGMSEASADVLARAGVAPADVHLVVPHQANLRIIEFVAKRAGISMQRVFLTIHKYGNMSAATVPVALVEALEAGSVPPHGMLLMPGFGAGLTYCSHLVRFGERVTPIDTVDVDVVPCERSALELVHEIRARKQPRGRSDAGLAAPIFPETQVIVGGAQTGIVHV
jgi:3-oxoacyl-[acyl-carrier-protein] synthase-3